VPEFRLDPDEGQGQKNSRPPYPKVSLREGEQRRSSCDSLCGGRWGERVGLGFSLWVKLKKNKKIGKKLPPPKPQPKKKTPTTTQKNKKNNQRREGRASRHLTGIRLHGMSSGKNVRDRRKRSRGLTLEEVSPSSEKETF